jgi:hypothetical protein
VLLGIDGVMGCIWILFSGRFDFRSCTLFSGRVCMARTCGIVLASFLYLLVSAVNRRDLEDRRWRGHVEHMDLLGRAKIKYIIVNYNPHEKLR